MVAPGKAEKGQAAASASKRVGYQGSEGCYAEQAAMRFFSNEEVTLVPFKVIDDVWLIGNDSALMPRAPSSMMRLK